MDALDQIEVAYRQSLKARIYSIKIKGKFYENNDL